MEIRRYVLDLTTWRRCWTELTLQDLARDWINIGLSNSSFHERYHPLEETDEFLQQLALAYPENVVLEEVGKSAEGRSIIAAAISKPEIRKKKKNGLKKKPRFVVLGAQHAREVRYEKKILKDFSGELMGWSAVDCNVYGVVFHTCAGCR